MIFFITQRDPFFVDFFFEAFDEFGNKYTIINLPNFNKGLIQAIWRTIKLYGLRGFFYLLYIKFSKLIRPIQLANMVQQYNFKSIDEAKNLLINLKKEDVVISLSAPSKIPVEWLDQAKAKVNIHCGKFPKYAGMMPIFWQIRDSLDEISITLHDLAEEIDTGKVFLERKIKLSHSLYETSRLAKHQSAYLLKEFLANVESNIEKAKGRQFFREEIVLRKFPTKKEIKEFKKIYKLI
jgi:methionyl-tRNA formyltransferase